MKGLTLPSYLLRIGACILALAVLVLISPGVGSQAGTFSWWDAWRAKLGIEINTEELGQHIEPGRRIVQDSGIVSDFSDTGELIAVAREIALQATSIGYSNIYALMAFSALAIIPLAFLQRRRR